MMNLKHYPTSELIAELTRRRDRIEVAIGKSDDRVSCVLNAVCSAWDVDLVSLVEHGRENAPTDARMAAMVILREQGHTLHAIGRAFNRDHSCVSSAMRSHRKRMSDPVFATKFEAAKRIIAENA